MSVGALFGFAKAVLALDLNVVEPLFESEADHLGTLRLGRPVGDQCEAHAERFEPVERLVSAREHAQLGVVDFVEAIGDRLANLTRWNRTAGGAREPGESLRDDVPPGCADTRAPVLVTRRVGPQMTRIGLDRGSDFLRRMGCQLFNETGNDSPPLVRRLAKGG